MRVLVADKLPPSVADHASALGLEVSVEPGLQADALEERLRSYNPDILVVRSTRVDVAHIEAAPRLSLVVRAGAGVNTIDLDACSDAGVFVANCPGKNAIAVAELAMGLILSLDRRIPDNVIELRAGTWNKGAYSKAEGLSGRTLGVIGLGRIGTALAVRAKAFGMRVVAWSRSLSDETATALDLVRLDSPKDVAAQADVVSVHLAAHPDTRGLIGAEVFEAMRPDTLFINTARAEVVDQQALAAALDRGIRAGLDVFANEPTAKSGVFHDPIAMHPNVYGTHHIGASTEQAQQAVAATVSRIIEVFHRAGNVPNCVNIAAQSRADHILIVRHRDKVGVLASVLDALRRSQINVQEMENTIFAGANAASARIQVSGAASPDLVHAIREIDHVLNVSLVPLGVHA